MKNLDPFLCFDRTRGAWLATHYLKEINEKPLVCVILN